ncbi:hypothetical protein BDB01DRAFT_598016 [Pilobolus umbonatus]|nr:hypothetical protein BDB01DRAFT_598016 [Pilobolus umbonatus]
MSSDGFTYSSNLLKRIKPISMKKNRKKNEGSKPSSMNKLQSLGMSIITSVSRRSKSETTKKNTTNDHHRNSNMMYTHIGDSKDRIERTPTLSYSTPTPSPVNPLFVIKPTVSTRPISQFFSSSTLIKENDKKLKRHSMMGSPYTNNSYINFYRGMPLSDTSSTRSSSLRTVRQSDLINDSSDYEPTTILPAEPLSPIEKRMMKTSRKEKRMSTVSLARARTAFGMDSIKSRENRAIHEWNEYISRSALEADNYMKEDGLHKILLHPFLLVK